MALDRNLENYWSHKKKKMDASKINPREKEGRTADHLANERTFLAWIRTSIAMMGFGFVIVKFALFIRQITFALAEKAVVTQKGYSAVIGVIMVAVGAIIAAMAFMRYRNIEKQLSTNSYFPSQWLSVLVTLTIIIVSILLVLYLFPNI
jgi:putative membrane protein